MQFTLAKGLLSSFKHKRLESEANTAPGHSFILFLDKIKVCMTGQVIVGIKTHQGTNQNNALSM